MGGAVLLAVALLLACASAASAAPGAFDPTFDGDGKKIIDYGGGESASAVAIQADGKIMLGGQGPDAHITLTRLNPDGSFDTRFGSAGRVSIIIPGYPGALLRSLALQDDGKIVALGEAGGVVNGVNISDVAIIRVNSDGSLDRGFGGSGIMTFGTAGSLALAGGLAIAPDHKIVFGYSFESGGTRHLAIGRKNPDGSPDPNFGFLGASGAVDFPGDNDFSTALALRADGKIVVAGGSAGYGVVGIMLPSAFADPSFGASGVRELQEPGEAKALALQPDGKILVGGSAGIPSDFAVWRLNLDGTLDTDFGPGGRGGVGFSEGRGFAMGLQANGKIVVAGVTRVGDFGIGRLQPGGGLDTTFSAGGKRTIDFGGTDDYAAGLALQANGAIVVAGRTNALASLDIAVARLEGDSSAAGGGGGPSGSAGAGKPPRCAGKRATIVGTNRSERLRGTKRADVIVGLGGNDRISGLRGSDRICAGKGKDRVSGGPGNDRIDGGAGNDILKGQGGKDTMSGGDGRDRMNGGAGRDNCNGGTGKDRATCERKRRV